MNILVTLDRNYLTALNVMLHSLFLNNPGERFHIYMAADGLTSQDLEHIQARCARFDSTLHPIAVQEQWFANAPTIRYYSRAMYYRLLAAQMLPAQLERVLYLDPDILVIGQVRAVYETQFRDELYAAAMHRGLTNVSGRVNKLRLPNNETDSYFNSGVLLMNLPQIRCEVRPEDIFRYAERYRAALILPDQDILNGLYAKRILPLDESYWNYDARKFEKYRLASQGEKDMDWVARHTVFLHFCGKNKPWTSAYHGRFSALYKHYQYLAEKFMP